MRPLAAIGVLHLVIADMTSPAPPPLKITAPVSPSKAIKRLLDVAPRPHTIASAWPSVVVTMGDPLPICRAHQATVGAGGLAALIFTATRSPLRPPGQLIPVPLNTTYVPCAVAYAAAAVMTVLDETRSLANHSPVVPLPLPMPPRLARLSR